MSLGDQDPASAVRRCLPGAVTRVETCAAIVEEADVIVDQRGSRVETSSTIVEKAIELVEKDAALVETSAPIVEKAIGLVEEDAELVDFIGAFVEGEGAFVDLVAAFVEEGGAFVGFVGAFLEEEGAFVGFVGAIVEEDGRVVDFVTAFIHLAGAVFDFVAAFTDPLAASVDLLGALVEFVALRRDAASAIERAMATKMPAAEVLIDASLVRSLLAEQHRDLADLVIRHVASGWDNELYRLGEELAVRLPRRRVAEALVEHEQRWLPELAPALPLPIPVPMRVGVATASYPWRWSITRWLPGEPAAVRAPDDLFDAAEVLGRFLDALHRPAPSDAPRNPYRGVDLPERAAATEARLDLLERELLRRGIDGARVRAVWRRLASTRAWPSPPVWLHGDLHPGNLLVADGRLSAVIDFGDITSGDPATDLAVAWMSFPPESRATLRAAAGDVDDDTWARARGWALALALAHLERSADAPLMARVAHDTLAAVLADED